jgi:uncharacterized protein (TIGR02996 family)
MSEDAFLQAITADPAGPTSRLVYADWLDERGDAASAAKAEFLRLEVKLRLRAKDAKRLTKAEKGELRTRLLELRVGMDQDWLARLDRCRIENCAVEFAFRCPNQWESLQPTEDAQVRHCDVCDQHVYHCGTISEAQEHALQQHCIAVDSRLSRTPGDLDPLPPRLMVLGKVLPSPRPSPPPRSLGEVSEALRGQRAAIRHGEYHGRHGTIVAADPVRRTVRVRLIGAGGRSVVKLSYDEIVLDP